MKRRLVSTLAIVIIISLVFVACTPSSNKNGKRTDNTKISELSFKVYQPIFSKSPLGTEVQNKWHKMMEDYMGMKLNIKWEELAIGEYKQRMNVYLASGDFADVFLLSFTEERIFHQMGMNGLVTNLLDYKENIPFYSKYIEQEDNKKRVTAPNGGIYGFADGTISTNSGNQHVNVIRLDTFKKHNLSVPNDLEQYYNVAKKLKDLYPESYPIGSFWSFIDTFFLINHTYPDIYYNGEKYIFGPIDDAGKFKDTLIYLNRLYQEKLLDPEFFVQSSDQAMRKMLTGKVFMVPSFSGVRINQSLNNNKENPEAKWGVIKQLNNSKGEAAWKLASTKLGKTLSLSSSIVISKKSPRQDLLVKLVDYQYSQEMIDLANWGIEGVTYQKNSDGSKDYLPIIKEAQNSAQKIAEFGVNQSMSVRSGIQYMLQDRDSGLKLLNPVPVYHNGKFYEDNYWHFTHVTGGKETIFPNEISPAIQFTAEEQDKIKASMSPIKTYIDEATIKFVTGDMSFDEWDKFISNIKSMGNYQAILEIYNSKLK